MRARLTMANTPKKVKDPTEVALSAIQEALNISDTSADHNRTSADSEMTPSGMASAAPSYSETPYDTRPSDRSSVDRSSVDRSSVDRPMFDQIEEPRAPRRAANDDRETIGQILQALQKGRPARSVSPLAPIFAATC